MTSRILKCQGHGPFYFKKNHKIARILVKLYTLSPFKFHSTALQRCAVGNISLAEAIYVVLYENMKIIAPFIQFHHAPKALSVTDAPTGFSLSLHRNTNACSLRQNFRGHAEGSLATKN